MYYKFEYKLQKSTLITFTRWLLLNNLFLLFKGMHFLCTTGLNISYKNQLILLSLGGCLVEKER